MKIFNICSWLEGIWISWTHSASHIFKFTLNEKGEFKNVYNKQFQTINAIDDNFVMELKTSKEETGHISATILLVLAKDSFWDVPNLNSKAEDNPVQKLKLVAC